MNTIKRKVKNIVRNIIMSDMIKNTKLISEMRVRRQARLDAERKKAFDEYGQECLELIKEVLDKENIEFWLDYGTLLGAMREKDFIAHDLDLDIGIFYSDNISRIEEALKKVNIKKIREFKLEEKIVEESYEYKGMLFDIFYYFHDNEKMWAHSFTFTNCKLEKNHFDDRDESTGFEGGIKLVNKFRGLEPIEFKGKEYLAPKDPIGYLIENYGPNYNIPIKEWDYFEAPTNREEFQCKDIVMIEYYK